ncbi:cache domain-containing sensor histidine kinase [Paenibacillus glycinis]|uniref:histidine kinase n=1 Tax=Paenibacillus glycinis TaxID=2697035 RepID=A0ABW9XYW6_9BACL|nr:histidine kinase [Paenibacillus glycinis]NBD27416.1 HAMP domain-containing protein [Paenibacillus glycinis]
MFYSLRNRLIVAFVLLFVLAFGALSILLFNQSRSIIRSYIESSALEKMDEYGSYIDMVQTQTYDLASLVFNSSTTDEWDDAVSDPALTDGEKMLAHLKMSKFLTQTTTSYSSVSSVSLYRREGMWVSMNNQVVKDGAFLGQEWYKNFTTQSVRWLAAHTDDVEIRVNNNTHPVVSMLMPIGTFEPAQAKVSLKVNVSADYFLEPLNRIHLGGSGTIYLLDQNGSPLLSQADYDTRMETQSEVKAVQDGWRKQGVIYFTNAKGQDQIMVYKKLSLNGWMLVGFVSERDLYAQLFNLRDSIVLLAALLLLLSLFIAFWLSHGITKPLSRLVSSMRHVQRGDFDSAESRLPPAGDVRNEVGFATATFRNMVGRLRHHIRNEFELKLLRQQAEYKALLMQINPHFMFNTLELLSSLAMQKRTDDTVAVIESLGKMLRFSLKINDDLIGLREELKYVRDYAMILQIRFGDRLRLTIEEDGNLEHVTVVKFILQPLIENAVKFAYAHQAEARVAVEARRADGRIALIVADNGPGMDELQRRRLLELADAARPEQALNGGDRQIGLGNVLARCRLYYGSLFEVRIASSEGEGTRIELILPVQEALRHVPIADRG